MNDRAPQQADGLRFFGRTVAGTVHELVNVLNIVGELAGLQDDLLRAAGPGGSPDPARLAAIVERARAQTERGHALLRHLSRFAHSVDHDVQRYDLGDLLESFASLSQRFARLASVQLAHTPPSRTVLLDGSPFAAHLALFLCLEAALSSAASQRAVKISASPGESGATLVVASADAFETPPDEALLRRLAAALEACPGELLGVPSAADPHRFTIRLTNARGTAAAS